MRYPVIAAIVAAAMVFAGAAAQSPLASDSVQVTLDRSEADAALAIMDAFNSGRAPTSAQLEALYGSRPYKRLRDRENAMKRPFTDAEFLDYLKSPEVRSRAAAFRQTLGRWRNSDVQAAAARAFAYLPPGSRLRATIFPMLKIKPNTFVFDLKDDPSIFYALDPSEPPAKFANTLAHEMHHIGLGQNCADAERPGSAGVTALRKWVGAFGEGLAMLAAAGSPATHPHADSSPEERAKWDSEVAKFADYLAQQNAFFTSALAGTAGDEAAIDKAMFAYFGEQGPWYTVGWRMAVTIEQELGRAAAIDAFCRSDTLLSRYNEAARLHRRRTGTALPLWDAALAAALAS